MSKFLTPPVWYDKNGNLNEMLTGNAGTSSDIAIGSGATAVGGGIAIGGSAGRGGVAIGGGASANEENGIAIGNSATLSEGGVIAIGHGATAGAPDSIAIGLNATVSESRCIAIGLAANVSTSDTIQLGNNDLGYTLNIGDGTGTINTGTITINGVRLRASGGVIQLGQNNRAYTLSVGNGTGTLEIGSIKFQKMTITNGTKVSISSRGVYLCCATKNNVSGVAICFIGDLDGSATVLESSTSLCKYVGTDISLGSSVHEIQAYSGATINYCFKVINVDF